MKTYKTTMGIEVKRVSRWIQIQCAGVTEKHSLYGIKPQEYVDLPQKNRPKAKDPNVPTETTVNGPITITGPVIIQFSDEQWSKIETLFKEVISNTVKESTKEAFDNL